MVDLGAEEDFGGDHGVFLWEEKLKGEHASLVGTVSWSSDFDIEMPIVRL